MTEPVNIGVISDTHGLLRPQAVAALAGSDLILHAGDIGDPSVLDELRRIAPLVAVRGNVDVGEWAQSVPETQDREIGGIRIHLLHNIGHLAPAVAADVVVFGHSHQPMNERRNGRLYFNPGSAGPRRFRLPIALGCLRIEGSDVSGEILELAV